MILDPMILFRNSLLKLKTLMHNLSLPSMRNSYTLLRDNFNVQYISLKNRILKVQNTVLSRELKAVAYKSANTLATVSPIAEGVGAMVTPSSLSLATFSSADSPDEEIIAPAWPIRRPLGAVKPAI